MEKCVSAFAVVGRVGCLPEPMSFVMVVFVIEVADFCQVRGVAGRCILYRRSRELVPSSDARIVKRPDALVVRGIHDLKTKIEGPIRAMRGSGTVTSSGRSLLFPPSAELKIRAMATLMNDEAT